MKQTAQKQVLEIVIGGRRFKPATESTLGHDIATQGHILRAGLSRIEMLPGEDVEGLALRLYQEACRSGEFLSLLAHLLLPADLKGSEWTPEVSAEVGQFFAGLTDPEDKRKVQAQLLSAFEGFMQAGLISIVVSQRSSLLNEADRPKIENQPAA